MRKTFAFKLDPNRKAALRLLDDGEELRSKVLAEIDKVLRDNGVASEVVYSFRKTGILSWPSQLETHPVGVACEWMDAVLEYFELAMDGASKPKS